MENNTKDTIKIGHEAIEMIAKTVIGNVPGIAGMSAGLVDGIAEIIGKHSLSKGLKVEVGEKEVAIDTYIIVEFGVRIPEVALSLQETLKRNIEEMTGLEVVEVNVHVQGVKFAEPEEEAAVRVR